MPPNTTFNDHNSVSEFLTGPWLWEELAPAEHVLVFQADSILCANSETRVDDFLHYDFVRAPIAVPEVGDSGHGEGVNGGLSLRNRSMILDIVKNSNWSLEMVDGTILHDGCSTTKPCLMFEDQWFYHKMKELGGRLPTKEVAMKFSVETV